MSIYHLVLQWPLRHQTINPLPLLIGDSSDDDFSENFYYGVIQSKSTGDIIDSDYNEQTKEIKIANPDDTELKYGPFHLAINKTQTN